MSEQSFEVSGEVERKVSEHDRELSFQRNLMLAIIFVLFIGFLGIVIATAWDYMNTVAEEEGANIELQKEVNALNQKIEQLNSNLPTPNTKARK